MFAGKVLYQINEQLIIFEAIYGCVCFVSVRFVHFVFLLSALLIFINLSRASTDQPFLSPPFESSTTGLLPVIVRYINNTCGMFFRF